MGKQTYIGRNGARKVTRGAVGVERTARKIKRAYIGVGGIARPCWKNGEIAYYGTVTPLALARKQMLSGSVARLAVYGGGSDDSGTVSSQVDAYDRNLTRLAPPSLPTAACDGAGGGVGDYVLLAGGEGSSGSSGIAAAYGYSTELTCTVAASLQLSRTRLLGVSTPTHVLVGPGERNSAFAAQVDAYDAQLTHFTAPNADTGRCYLGGAAVGGYAVFAGGYTRSGSSLIPSGVVDAYDADLTHVSCAALSQSRAQMGYAGTAEHALFDGGTNGSAYYDAVDAYDTDLTRVTLTDIKRRIQFGGCLGEKAVFAGGHNGSARIQTAAFYDNALTRTDLPPLSDKRSSGRSCGSSALTVGDFLLIAGEDADAAAPTAVAEAYVLN